VTVYPWQDAPAATFAVIGDPIAHSKSPAMHMAAYAASSLGYEYVAIHVPAGQAPEALDSLLAKGYRGVNVTLPHKGAAYEWCSTHTPEAKAVEAVNTINFATRTGHNTDIGGFLSALPQGWEGMRILLIGAGGSARAVAYALRNTALSIWNRTPIRAAELARVVGGSIRTTNEIEVADYDLLINATSASHSNETLAIDWSKTSFESAKWAYDLSYQAGLTPFLQSAEQAGYSVIDGRAMLAEQGALAFEWWLNLPAPRQTMREVLGR
jgi:shikimate dehydrogenase